MSTPISCCCCKTYHVVIESNANADNEDSEDVVFSSKRTCFYSPCHYTRRTKDRILRNVHYVNFAYSPYYHIVFTITYNRVSVIVDEMHIGIFIYITTIVASYCRRTTASDTRRIFMQTRCNAYTTRSEILSGIVWEKKRHTHSVRYRNIDDILHENSPTRIYLQCC